MFKTLNENISMLQMHVLSHERTHPYVSFFYYRILVFVFQQSMEWEVMFTDSSSSILNNSGPVKLLDEKLATKILQDPWVMKNFFLSGLCTMHAEWYPMKVTLRNMKRLAEANHVVTTMASEGQGQHKVKAISFGQMILLPCGEMYTIFFHGDKLLDFKDHVIFHLGIFKKVRNPTLDTFVQLNYPSTLKMDEVRIEMEKYFRRFLWSGGAVTNVTNLDKYLESKAKAISVAKL